MSRFHIHLYQYTSLTMTLGMQDTYFNHLETPSFPFSSPLALSHRYEGREDLVGKPRQGADWAGGGLVSSTRDLNVFLLEGLVQGKAFAGEKKLKEKEGKTPSMLQQMLSDRVPTAEEVDCYSISQK